MRSDPPRQEYQYDPVFLHARREMLVIIALFAAFCAWSIFVCYQSGYVSTDDGEVSVPIILGMPAWVFWGILLPWLLVDLVAAWFCFAFMAVDDLGEAHEDEDLIKQVARENDGQETWDD